MTDNKLRKLAQRSGATDIKSFKKHLEGSSGHTLSLYLKFGEISFQEYVSEGISFTVI